MNNDLKTSIINAIRKKSYSDDIKDIVNKYTNDIESSTIEGETVNILDPEQVINIYEKRKESLLSRNIAHYGINETLNSMKKQCGKIRIVQMKNIISSMTLFLNESYSEVLGIIVIINPDFENKNNNVILN